MNQSTLPLESDWFPLIGLLFSWIRSAFDAVTIYFSLYGSINKNHVIATTLAFVSDLNSVIFSKRLALELIQLKVE